MENMILMGSIVDDALEAIQTGLLWVCLCLDNAVYSLVNFVYQIILVLARVNVFEDTSVIDNFVNRVYIIIGVVALFLLAYSLLKALINPDEGLKGKNSPQKVIVNVLTSIALIAFTPTIFSVAMGFQNSLLEQGTLTGIIVGSSGAEESAQTISDGGFNLAAGVFQAFFHPNSDYCQYFINSIPGEENINLTGSGCTELEVLNGTYTYSGFWESMSAENSFSRLPELNKDILGKIDYTWLLSTAVGIFVVIVLVSYCIDIAIRAIKLAAYQLIAPIPILARLLPGDQGSKVFSNWVKACISTYLEVFIRLGILFFVVLIIAALQRNIGGLFSTFQTDAGFGIGFLAWAFLIVGLIFFIKDFPNIIKEITGLDSSKFNVLGGAMRTMAAFGGGVTAAVRNWNDKDHLKGKNNVIKTMDRLRRAAAGAGSGMIRSTMNRDNVKDFRSMRANARDSANRAFQAHQERIAYSDSHPGVFGSFKGHMKDTKDKINYWAHGNVDDKRLQTIVDLAGKVGKGANDSVESLMAMIHGGAKEQKRQLDAMKNRTVEVTDYFDSIVDVDDKGNQVVKYVEKGANLNDPSVRAKAIDASAARQVAQEANAKLYKDAKDKFEETYSQAIASLYTTNLNDPSSNISAAREAWGIKSSVSDADARRQLEGFRNQITNRLNTIALDQTVAKETDASFNNLKSLNVENIVEQLAQAEAKTLEKNHISYNIADLRKKYSTDTNAIAKQIMSNISTNKAVAGEIQREVEYQAAEAKVRNARLNNDKKKD